MFGWHITTTAVMDFAERCEIGAELNAEVFDWKASGGIPESYGHIERVTVLEKYPHFAMTDHGAVEWTNLAIRNPQYLRKELMRSE